MGGEASTGDRTDADKDHYVQYGPEQSTIFVKVKSNRSTTDPKEGTYAHFVEHRGYPRYERPIPGMAPETTLEKLQRIDDPALKGQGMLNVGFGLLTRTASAGHVTRAQGIKFELKEEIQNNASGFEAIKIAAGSCQAWIQAITDIPEFGQI